LITVTNLHASQEQRQTAEHWDSVKGMTPVAIERRSGIERREMTLTAYWHGTRNPRRRSGRRAADNYPVVDWHAPRLLALALTILALCILDGVLTLHLIGHGAIEMNPLMALLVPANPTWFAAVKVTLTGLGMSVLVACSRMRLFRTIPVELVLYLVVACYVVLIAYEFRLLALIATRHP
jgi:hypothetical protein